MNSRTTQQFRTLFAALPAEVQRQGRAAYRLFQQNPQHPGLHLRQVHPVEPVYSARIGMHYRAVGVRDDNEIVWFWVGPHAEYDKLLTRF